MSRLEKAELPSVPSHIGDAMLARHSWLRRRKRRVRGWGITM
jgi:hypothetical protein